MSPRPRQPDLATSILTGLGTGLLGIGKWLWRVVTGGKQRSRLNRAALFADWQVIEQLVDTSDAHQAAQAVSQADRFVDHVMRLAGGRGQAFAERLRSLEGKFDRATYQALWEAHKLRNRLAHEHGSEVAVSESQRAIRQFRSAARALGAF